LPTHRRFNSLLIGTTRVCLLLALAIGAIAAARIGLSDRFRWSQYLFWVPAIALLLPAVSLWIAGSLLALASRPAKRRTIPGRRLGWAAGIMCAFLALHLALIDYRLFNRVRAGSVNIGPGMLRILNWNASTTFEADRLWPPILEQQADIAITVDASGIHWSHLREYMGEGGTTVRSGNMHVLSAVPILRHGMASLDAPDAGPVPEEHEEQVMGAMRGLPLLRHAVPPDGLRPRHDEGRAWYVEFDTTLQLGRTTIIWLIDLPSDIRLPRSEVTRRARRAIETWEGSETVILPDAVITRQAGPGFPAPDLILGDFNIPRGSHSLRALSLGYPHAHSQAGWGHSGTYPRHRPLVHIDNMYISPALMAQRYEIIDPGAGSHRMQVVEVRSRGK
jgi:hypothetical protein